MGLLWFFRIILSYKTGNRDARGKKDFPGCEIVVYTRESRSFRAQPIYCTACPGLRPRLLNLAPLGLKRAVVADRLPPELGGMQIVFDREGPNNAGGG